MQKQLKLWNRLRPGWRKVASSKILDQAIGVLALPLALLRVVAARLRARIADSVAPRPPKVILDFLVSEVGRCDRLCRKCLSCVRLPHPLLPGLMPLRLLPLLAPPLTAAWPHLHAPHK